MDKVNQKTYDNEINVDIDLQKEEDNVMLQTNLLIKDHFREYPEDLSKTFEKFDIIDKWMVWDGILDQYLFDQKIIYKDESANIESNIDDVILETKKILNDKIHLVYLPFSKETYSYLRKNMYIMKQNNNLTNTLFSFNIICENIYRETFSIQYYAKFKTNTIENFKELVLKIDETFYIPLINFELYDKKLDDNNNTYNYENDDFIININCNNIIII